MQDGPRMTLADGGRRVVWFNSRAFLLRDWRTLMRTGYLVAAVLLFAAGGAAFGQSTNGRADVGATGGGNSADARAAARLERRELRSDRRASRLETLRASGRLNTQLSTGDSLPDTGDLGSGDESTPAATDDSEVRGNGRGNGRGGLLGLFTRDEAADTEDSDTAAPRGRGVGFFSSRNQTGEAEVDAETSTDGQVTDPQGHFEQARADRILAHRLAQIDKMRDRALAEGNDHLLDVADQLEATARAQYFARVGVEAPIGDDPAPTDPPVDDGTQPLDPPVDDGTQPTDPPVDDGTEPTEPPVDDGTQPIDPPADEPVVIDPIVDGEVGGETTIDGETNTPDSETAPGVPEETAP